ncbi:5688_t:CDS:2 [Cetraspora pellucida]|uniref:5688_t:CDS:1 n=1 Tax=Cetraspora pellucida TaxID=1433469 RepID=A0ACA9K202_9GLOM|nr:5688_t:CDS:2 [Cetraspora pellucida]
MGIVPITMHNSNENKAKKNKDEEIKRCQDLAYTQDQLVNVFLDFLDLYEDFDNVELCKQKLNIDIAIFLNSFIDHIKTQNEDEKRNPIPIGFFKKFNEHDNDNLFKHLLENLFQVLLNKPAIKQALDTTSELLPQDDILQDNVLPQDDVLLILSQDNIIFQNDELP